MKNLVALWRFIVDVALRWYHGGIGDLAAGVTFWILVSLPASILALIAALGWLDNVINFSFAVEVETTVLDFVDRVFTSEGSNIRPAVEALFRQQNAQLLTISLAVAMWSISRGFAGLIRALDDIYDVEDSRTWYYTRVVAVFLGVGSLLISVPLVMMDRLVWDRVPDGLIKTTASSVVALAVLVSWASTIYHFGPAQRSRWRYDLPGAVVAAVLWWVLTVGFGFYVSLTSSSNGVTAAVGAGLLGLTWLWLAAQVLLIGGAVNYLFGVRYDISRQRRSWNLNERLSHHTGELRKIVVSDRGNSRSRRTAAQEAEPVLPDRRRTERRRAQPAAAPGPAEVIAEPKRARSPEPSGGSDPSSEVPQPKPARRR